MRQINEVDDIMEEIKESFEVSKEEDKIIQEIILLRSVPMNR